jgi:glycosyltransferase involved in cell wall biosynthesis
LDGEKGFFVSGGCDDDIGARLRIWKNRRKLADVIWQMPSVTEKLMARIVTVYRSNGFALDDMSGIRWLKISEALARAGHQVDLAIRGDASALPAQPNLGHVALDRVDWRAYDAVKTLFHHGFDVLGKYGGTNHPFIISKLGSVVGARDMNGIYFYGRMRRALYATQKKIARTSRYVTVLSAEARALWHVSHGGRENVLLVPGAVDREIPPPLRDPYPADKKPRALFAGNIYDRFSQPRANRVLVNKLNALGKALTARGIRLYLLGIGDASKLDPQYVTYLGAVPYAESWDYIHSCDVGIVASAGPFMQNNESTKIYHYLRAGRPVVSEAGFPNDHVVRRARCGFVVENGDMQGMAEHVERAAREAWDREFAVQYILEHHTWDVRARVYDRLLRQAFGG